MLKAGLICISLFLLTGCVSEIVQQEKNVIPNGLIESYSASEAIAMNIAYRNQSVTSVSMVTWQEAYLELLREYLYMPVGDGHIGWRFILYDIDMDGIPELIILQNQGILSDSTSAYTFKNGEIILLEKERPIWFLTYSAPLGNRPGIVATNTSDGIGSYMHYDHVSFDKWQLIAIYEYALNIKIIASRVAFCCHAGGGSHWYVNGDKVTESEFLSLSDSVFGRWNELFHQFGYLPIELSKSNILNAIFGRPPSSVVSVDINGQIQSFEFPPQIVNGRVMLPIHCMGKSLSLYVDFDSRNNLVTLIDENLTITHRIRTNVITVNGITLFFDAPSVIIEGNVLVPARMIAEAMDAVVEWNETTRVITITTN